MSTEPKPSRLAGLIAPKGTAARPAEEPQREAAPAAPAPRTSSMPAAASAAPALPTLGSKSLTLRLPDPDYERLRAYAFEHRKSHQAVLSEALKAYLDAMT